LGNGKFVGILMLQLVIVKYLIMPGLEEMKIIFLQKNNAKNLVLRIKKVKKYLNLKKFIFI